MILLKNIHKMVDKGAFDIAFVAESGETIAMQNVILTNWHSKGRTLNVKSLVSKQVRTIRRCTIVSFNNEEVAL